MSDLDKHRAEQAFQLENRIKQIKYEVSRSFLELAKAIKEIRDNQYYVELGYDTITEWFSSPDISISATWAWNIIAIYEVFVIEHKIDPEKVVAADYSKLHQVVPVVRKHPDQVDDWLEKAQTLRRIDLQKEISAHRIKEKADAYLPPEVKNDKVVLRSDVVTGLKEIEAESVDTIITTPPDISVDMHMNWLTEAYRVLKNTGSMFIFTNKGGVYGLGKTMQILGMHIINEIVWVKPDSDKPISLNRLVESHEDIIWARKGHKNTCNLVEVTTDVWTIPNHKAYDHPLEKPEFVIEELINMGTDVGSLVLDPFTAAGGVLAVAKRMNRQYMGITTDPNWHKVVLERLDAKL